MRQFVLESGVLSLGSVLFISNDHSPGGGHAGAVVMTLQRLEPFFGTHFS